MRGRADGQAPWQQHAPGGWLVLGRAMVEWGVVPGLYTPPASLQTPNPSGSGAHADGDAVELVEAAPRPRLGQAAINLSHGPEVHLVRALGCGLGVRGGQAGGTGGLARALLSPCPTPPNPTPLPHVEDIALHSQGPGQIFCRLRLARPGGARGGAAEVHGQGLREGDVAPVREGGHDEALLDAFFGF